MALDTSSSAFSHRQLPASARPAAGMAFAGASLALSAPGAPTEPAERLVEAALADAAAARAVGRAWLLACGDVPDLKARLEAFLKARPEVAARLAEDDGSALTAALEARARHDFALGRTVLVERRTLAETEADLCALACPV